MFFSCLTFSHHMCSHYIGCSLSSFLCLRDLSSADAEGMPSVPGSRPAGEIGLNSVEPLKYLNLFKDQRSKFGTDQDCMDGERIISQSMAPWKATEQDSGFQSNPLGCPASPFVDMGKSGFQFENDILSSSLSEAFSRECKLHSPCKC